MCLNWLINVSRLFIIANQMTSYSLHVKRDVIVHFYHQVFCFIWNCFIHILYYSLADRKYQRQGFLLHIRAHYNVLLPCKSWLLNQGEGVSNFFVTHWYNFANKFLKSWYIHTRYWWWYTGILTGEVELLWSCHFIKWWGGS